MSSYVVGLPGGDVRVKCSRLAEITLPHEPVCKHESRSNVPGVGGNGPAVVHDGFRTLAQFLQPRPHQGIRKGVVRFEFERRLQYFESLILFLLYTQRQRELRVGFNVSGIDSDGKLEQVSRQGLVSIRRRTYTFGYIISGATRKPFEQTDQRIRCGEILLASLLEMFFGCGDIALVAICLGHPIMEQVGFRLQSERIGEVLNGQ